MSNKFKLKKKLVSIALALALAAQPLASFPMNVFAGTGKNGVMKAPTIPYSFDLDTIIELAADANVAAHAKNIQPQGATVGHEVESQTVFGDGDTVLDTAGNVINPGIAKIKVKVGDVLKETYIIADINGILTAYDAAAYDAADAAAYAAAAAAANDVFNAAAYAAYAAADAAAYAASNADAYDAADDAADDAYDAWADSYGTAVDGVVRAIVVDYKAATADEQKKKDWLGAVYAAVKAAKKMTDKNGLDLEAKLKIAHMAYRIAQFTWLYNATEGDRETKAKACEVKADALQQMIDKVYADKVGDIEEQAAKVTPPQGGVG